MSHSPRVPYGCSPGTMERIWRYEELPKAQLYSSFLAPWLPWLTSHLNSILLIFGNGSGKGCSMLGSVGIQSLWTGQYLGHTVVIWFLLFLLYSRHIHVLGKAEGELTYCMGSVIKQVACMGCDSCLNASSSPDPALPARKALPKGQVQTGTPILSSCTFILWRIDNYMIMPCISKHSIFSMLKGSYELHWEKKLGKRKLLIRNRREIRTDNNC